MDCLCGHHAIECPLHGEVANRANVDDVIITADDWEEFNRWCDAVDAVGA